MLRLYDELPPEEAEELDVHLAGCENCRRELAALRALGETLAAAPPPDPSTKLLSDTRQRLAASLDAEAARRSRFSVGHRIVHAFTPIFHGLRRGPVAAAAMLLIGVGFGSVGGYRIGIHNHAQPPAVSTTQLNPVTASPIASVSSVTPQPDGKGVVVRYNRLVPESATGSTNDPAIRNLLAMGIQSPTGPDVQDDSVRLLTDSCSHGPQCDDGRLRNALMSAARYEGDADLRSQALAGLEPYIAEDTHVRDVFLDSVMHDRSAAVRNQAIRMLSPVEGDSSVRQVLHNASTNDQDPQVRSTSRIMFQNASDIGLQYQ